MSLCEDPPNQHRLRILQGQQVQVQVQARVLAQDEEEVVVVVPAEVAQESALGCALAVVQGAQLALELVELC